MIFGIKFADQVSKKFNFNIFQYSFGDGNLNFTLDLNSSEELNEFLKNENIINFYFDKKNNNYSYRIVFKTKKDLMEFTEKAKKQDKIINIRADIQS